MRNCTFCKIIKNEIPSYPIYEDENCVVILTRDPVMEGHVLIIPKLHVMDITDENFDLEIGTSVIKLAKLITTALKDVFDYTGYSIEAWGGDRMDVPHFHMHVSGARLKDKDLYWMCIPSWKTNWDEYDKAMKATQDKLITYLDNSITRPSNAVNSDSRTA